MIEREQIANRTEPKSNFIWGVFCVGVLIVSCATIQISPTIWQDEVQIIEFGRCTLNPGTDWSVNTKADGKPAFIISYLGAVIQELSFQLTQSPIGPRFSSIVGAIVAATLCRVWLLLKEATPLSAGLTAGIFLLDPIFVQGYKGARVDSWAMTFVFLSLIAVRVGLAQRNPKSTFRWCILAGAFAVVAGFTWISAILIWPLVATELIISRSEKKLVLLVGIGCGAIFAATILLLPVSGRLFESVSNTLSHVGSDSIRSSLRLQIPELLQTVKLSPFFLAAAFVGILTVKREVAYALPFVASLVFMLLTRMYEHRYIYLLPYVCVITEAFARRLNKFEFVVAMRKLYVGSMVLSLLFAWAAILTLVVRPVLALQNATGRDPNKLVSVANDSIGVSKKVYMGSFDFYYAGRVLDWRMFQVYDYDVKNEKTHLAGIDYILASTRDEEKWKTIANGRIHKVSQFSIGLGVKKQASIGASSYGPNYTVLQLIESN